MTLVYLEDNLVLLFYLHNDLIYMVGYIAVEAIVASEKSLFGIFTNTQIVNDC